MESDTDVTANSKKGKTVAAASKQKNTKKSTTGTKAKTTVSAKKSTTKTPQTNSLTMITPQERLQMIEKAAYYLAEQRGFVGGDAAEDWTRAEQEIDNSLKKQSHEAA